MGLLYKEKSLGPFARTTGETEKKGCQQQRKYKDTKHKYLGFMCGYGIILYYIQRIDYIYMHNYGCCQGLLV